MKISVRLAFCIALIYSVSSSGQTFKQHKIGETAEQFFSIATMSGKGTTAQYCKDYLSDPKVSKAYAKSQRNMFDTNAKMQSIDVEGCWKVQQAFEGKEVEIGARYASEVGKGTVTFRSSRLVLMAFDVPQAPLDDVVTDISKELGDVQPTMSVDTKQNAFGASVQERKATWHANNLTVVANEVRDFRFGNMGVLVLVRDSEYFKQKDTERQANRVNTIK